MTPTCSRSSYSRSAYTRLDDLPPARDAPLDVPLVDVQQRVADERRQRPVDGDRRAQEALEAALVACAPRLLQQRAELRGEETDDEEPVPAREPPPCPPGEEAQVREVTQIATRHVVHRDPPHRLRPVLRERRAVGRPQLLGD